MNFEQYTQKLNQRIAEIRGGRAVRIAAFDTTAEYGQRIFERGKNSAGGEIGQYSKKELWASAKNSPRKPNEKGKTGKDISGGYYKDGYFEYKGDMGRENASVNLVLFGELKSDVYNGQTKAEPTKVSETHYQIDVKNEVNALKIEGQEKRFGVIFNLTQEEKQHFIDVANFETMKILAE